MQQIFEKFMLRYQAERNPARNTVLALQSTLPRFLSYCQEKGREDINQIAPQDVLDYLNHALNGNRSSSKKLAKTIIMIFMNACFRYGYLREKMPRIDFKGPVDVPRAPLKGFTAEEMETMAQNLNRLDLRDRIIFRLISSRPLRIQELVNLTTGDVDLQANTFTIYRSKNTKTRTLSIPKDSISAIRSLIDTEAPRDTPLFGIGLRSMEFVIKEIIKKLRVSPNGRASHAFRHTVIMRMLREGKIDPAIVATLAGNTPQTIYRNYSGQVSFDEQKRALQAFDQIK